jgi:hypothetical protein
LTDIGLLTVNGRLLCIDHARLESILAATPELDRIRSEAEKIVASGVLGRSRFYSALFEYLLECGERGHTPKEIEIAADVFDRGDEFDPSQDSMVRVYAYNLRQKLQQYYSEHAVDAHEQLTIPKGEYRIVLATVPSAPASAQPAAGPRAVIDSRLTLALVAVACLTAGLLLGRLAFYDGHYDPVYRQLADSAIWAPVTDDDTPVTIVVGDYYIFGELDQYGNVARMVREFEINSARELDEHFMLEPEDADRYVDLDLTYLPTSTAVAMRDLMEVLAAADKMVRVVASSNLDTAIIRESHVIYLGYLSGLGMLSDFFFSASDLSVGETYDELVNDRTGEVFVSEAGLPTTSGSYHDYGLFATLPGPGGNQMIVVAGTRDEGLMQTAATVSDPELAADSIEALRADDGTVPDAFEVVYEVAGLDRTNLSATIVHTAALGGEGSVTVGQLTP